MFIKYNVALRLFTEQLATNPKDPCIREKHLIHSKNDLIEKFGKTKNASMSTFNGAEKISDETISKEIEDAYRTLENFIGRDLTEEDKILLAKNPKEFFKLEEDSSGPGITVFFWDPIKKRPFLRGHMVKGFLKSASEAFCRIQPAKKKKEKGEEGDSEKGKWMSSISQNKLLINQLVSVSYKVEIESDIERNEDGTPKYLQRSLRPQTGKTTIATSEVIPAGSLLTFQLTTLGDNIITEKILKDLFEYGQLMGIGQWRNAGHGQFSLESFERIKE